MADRHIITVYLSFIKLKLSLFHLLKKWVVLATLSVRTWDTTFMLNCYLSANAFNIQVDSKEIDKKTKVICWHFSLTLVGSSSQPFTILPLYPIISTSSAIKSMFFSASVEQTQVFIGKVDIVWTLFNYEEASETSLTWLWGLFSCFENLELCKLGNFSKCSS